MMNDTRDERWFENRRCRRKHRYDTKSAAIGKINELYQEGKAGKKFGLLAPYACEYCRGWHIGHYSDGILADGQEAFIRTKTR